MKRLEKLKKKISNFIHEENKGAALVMVIIAMAFIGILVSVVCYTAVFNYHMKVNSYKAKDSFYNAETVLDEIKAGVEVEASASIATHYMEVLQSFSIGTSEEKNDKIALEFYKDMIGIYRDGDDSRYDLDRLASYIVKAPGNVTLEAGELIDGSMSYHTDYGVMEHYMDGIVFRDLRVTYTDADGYVSVIETDIKLKGPSFDFVSTGNLPSLSEYSLIAKTRLKTIGSNTVSGSFYAGELVVGDETSPVGATLSLKENAANVISDKRMIVAGDIKMAQSACLEADQYGEIWAENIHMIGHNTVNFAGDDVYLSDDVMISGDENSFTVGAVVDSRYSGKFVGFGNGNADARNEEALKEAGSAIVVNGTNTTIDFSSLTSLTIAGNGYVELYTAEDAVPEGIYNPVMGQSIAVKSDQLAYLVPAECIGVGSDGVSRMTNPTNPISIETYNELFVDNEENLKKVSVTVPITSLGGRTLSDYGITESNIMMKARQLNSMTTLYYFYLSFDSSNEQSKIYANRYFSDYYNANKTKMDAYQSLYTKSVVLRNPETSFYTLHMAGNAICKRYIGEEDYRLQNATLSYDRGNSGYQSDLTGYENKRDALELKLVDVKGQLTPTEQSVDMNGKYTKTAYDNIVDVNRVTQFTIDAGIEASVNGGSYNLYDGEDVIAYVINGDYTHSVGAVNKGVIIAAGNVHVNANFEGLIISGGEVTLANDISIRPNAEAMQKALTLTQTVNGTKYRVAEFLLGGEGYLNTANTMYATNRILVEDLIVYENWEKK